MDKRDNMVLPTEGYFVKLSQVCLSLSSVLKKCSYKDRNSTKHANDRLEKVIFSYAWFGTGSVVVTQHYVTSHDREKGPGLNKTTM